MRLFHMRRFAGIETKYDPADQDRGTLRRADSILVAPVGTLSRGPRWHVLHGGSSMASLLSSAVAGLADGVHFLTIRSAAGWTLLVAWDRAPAVPVGIWHVSGSITGLETAPLTVSLEPVGEGMQAGRQWFGRWIGERLFLGNGLDRNLCWAENTLRLLGAEFHQTHDRENPAAHEFPPCTCFTQDTAGRIFAAGNQERPLRIWISDPASRNFPVNEGVRYVDRSSVEVFCEGARITSIAMHGARLIAHLGDRGAVAVTVGYDADTGFNASQVPMIVGAGAANPNCTHDTKGLGVFLGSDGEIYENVVRPGREHMQRDGQIITNKASGDWNVQTTMQPDSSSLVMLDDLGNRLWTSLPLKTGKNGLFCYDTRTFAMTGPWHTPDLLCASRVRLPSASGVPAVGLTRAGALLFCNLSSVGAVVVGPPSVGSRDWATIEPTLSPSYVGLSADGTQLSQVIDGQATILTRDGWQPGTPSATRWIPGAQVAIIDLATEDFGTPTGLKDFLELIVQAERGSIFYLGIEVQDDEGESWWWVDDLVTWQQERRCIAASGTDIKVRLAVIHFPDAPMQLTSLTLGFLPSAEL